MKFLFLLQCSVFLIRSANSFHAKLGFVSHRRLVSRRLSGSSAVSDEVPGEEPKKELGELAQQGRKMADMLKDVPVFLVGMMGSGKSTIGDLFARSLGRYTFLDTDDVIEKLAGMSIPEIFESEGEDEFRKTETAVLTQVQAYVRTVVSTGGGIVLSDANWGKMQSGLVVFLDVPPDALAARLSTGTEVDGRPVLKGDSSPETIRALLESRLVKYEQADVKVRLDGTETLDDCVKATMDAIKAYIDSNPPKWKQWKSKATLPQK